MVCEWCLRGRWTLLSSRRHELHGIIVFPAKDVRTNTINPTPFIQANAISQLPNLPMMYICMCTTGYCQTFRLLPARAQSSSPHMGQSAYLMVRFQVSRQPMWKAWSQAALALIPVSTSSQQMGQIGGALPHGPSGRADSTRASQSTMLSSSWKRW